MAREFSGLRSRRDRCPQLSARWPSVCWRRDESTPKPSRCCNRLVANRSFFFGLYLILGFIAQACDGGDGAAAHILSTCYLGGVGVAQDEEHALRLLREAAARRYPAALHDLALRHLSGEGAAKDFEVAGPFSLRAIARSYGWGLAGVPAVGRGRGGVRQRRQRTCPRRHLLQRTGEPGT